MLADIVLQCIGGQASKLRNRTQLISIELWAFLECIQSAFDAKYFNFKILELHRCEKLARNPDRELEVIRF